MTIGHTAVWQTLRSFLVRSYPVGIKLMLGAAGAMLILAIGIVAMVHDGSHPTHTRCMLDRFFTEGEVSAQCINELVSAPGNPPFDSDEVVLLRP